MTPLLVLRWLARILAALVVVAALAVGAVAARVWWVARQDDHPRSDALVVLGASQYDGRPSQVFRSRLEHARQLYAAGVAARIVTVGGKQPADRFTEAAAGADWLAGHGVPRAALVVVPDGRDTLGSLRAVHAAFRAHAWTSAVLVTDPWHSLRARAMARDLGLHADTSPSRSGPAVASRSTELRYIARETAAYLYYAAFHDDAEHYAGAV